MAIGGSKDFGFVKLRPDLQPVKVVTVTLGHPVEPTRYSGQQRVEPCHKGSNFLAFVVFSL